MSKQPVKKAKESAESRNAGQSSAFIETARELGCDEDEAAFDARLRGIAKQKEPTGVPKPALKKPRRPE